MNLAIFLRRLLPWLLAMALIVYFFHYYLMDGLTGLYASILFGEDTYYSENYSSFAFRRVQPGMTKREVEQLLGKPLSRYHVEDDLERWRYSGRRSDTSYRVRGIVFRNGRVIRKVAYFYLD